MGIQIHKVAEYGSPTLDPDPQHWVMQYAKQNVKYCYIVPGQAVTGIIFPLLPFSLLACCPTHSQICTVPVSLKFSYYRERANRFNIKKT